MKFITLAATVLLASSPALAQEMHHYSPSEDAEAKAAKTAEQDAQGVNGDEKHTLVITPVDNCFAKLSKEDVADIQMNYEKPYKECLRRLNNNENKKNSLNISPAAKKPLVEIPIFKSELTEKPETTLKAAPAKKSSQDKFND